MTLMLNAQWCALLALGACTLSTACVQRECTDEEREAAGADANDDCVRLVALHTFTSDDPEERTTEWSSGTDIKIGGLVRSVSIVKGDEASLSVTYSAQVDLAEDREASVVKKTMSHLKTSLTQKDGFIEVSASREDTDSNLGAAIVVHLPAEFDSNLIIDKTTSMPGDVALKFLGDTNQLVVDMNALGADLSITDAGALRRATLNTRGDIEISSSFASLDSAAIHTSHGDITARFSVVPEGHVKVFADFGELGVALPALGKFNLRAEAEQGVSTGNPPEHCKSNSVPSPKLVQCDGGDPDGLTFELRASQEIQLSYQ
jgi:hypothetical protein